MTPNKYGMPQKRKSNRAVFLLIGIVVIAAIAVGAYAMLGHSNNQNTNPTPTPTTSPGTSPTTDPYEGATQVLLHTSMGDITIALRNDMPITTGNFERLVGHGTYNGTIFHRVISGFMIQGGDPTGTGFGDPSIPNIQDEFTSTNRNDRGTIAMANTGEPNSGSSQFFINQVNNNYLDTKHPVFGKVISGMDVLDAIANVPTDSNDKPIANVTIISASIIP